VGFFALSSAALGTIHHFAPGKKIEMARREIENCATSPIEN